MYYPRVPEVTDSDIRVFKQASGELSSVRGTDKPCDFDVDPQDYINKAVKKYAGNTFILPNPEEDGEDKDKKEKGPAHQTFFIPKDISQKIKGPLDD